MAGSHSHDDGAMPASPQVRRLLTWIMVPLVLVTVVALALLWPQRPEPPADNARGTYYGGAVVEVHARECTPEESSLGRQRCGEVAVRVTEGPDAGHTVTTAMPDGPGAPVVAVGDEVILFVGYDPADPSVRRYDIADHQRGSPLLLLVGLFAVAIVGFGRLRGLASLAGLGSCFVLLVFFVLPGIISGHSPLLIAVVGAAMVIFVIMYLVHGVSVRTSVAVLGTLGALVITGVLGVLATSVAHLTGSVGEEERILWVADPTLDLRGLLLAGIIIGSLGVLDDVTVSQSATVAEIARADPSLSRRELYRAGSRVGRSHVASVVNTLVLAYAGASLPLLILIVTSAGGESLVDVLTTEAIAQEIVRSAVATVGLVAAVPLTTGLAALVCSSAGRVPARRAPVRPRDRVPGAAVPDPVRADGGQGSVPWQGGATTRDHPSWDHPPWGGTPLRGDDAPA